MNMSRVAVIYDDRQRPETTGTYCLRALRSLIVADHLLPDQTWGIARSKYDLYIRVDDGLDYPLPSSLRPLAWWAIDTHVCPERCLAQASLADMTFAAQKQGVDFLRQEGVTNPTWLPLACDPTIHRRHEGPKIYDFCFVGNLFPGPRLELLKLLRTKYAKHFVGQAYFEEMARVYSASRVAFNRSIGGDLNMRVFEALACGSLLLTDALPGNGQSELFRDGQHFGTYRDAGELMDKFAFYLRRESERIRVETAGRQEVVDNHTYRHRMERLLMSAESRAHWAPVRLFDGSRAAKSTPDSSPSYFDFDRPELLALVPLSAREVVDVGCANGRLGAAIKARQPARVVGIELDPRAASLARSRLDAVIEANAEEVDWPFAPAQYDTVICGDILEHLREPLVLLRRIRQWLRSSGTLVVSLPNVRHHCVIRGLLAGNWTYESAGLLDKTHIRFFTKREMEKLLYRAGFQVTPLRATPGPGYREWEEAGRPGRIDVGGLQISPVSPAEAEEFYAYQWLAAVQPDPSWSFRLTSIVIVTHNQIAYTRQCIDSIRLLTDEPIEILFVDNGSNDGTPAYLHELADIDSRVRVILNRENRGFPTAANQGIRQSNGSQVLLLNNDTIVTTGWLRRMLRTLESDPRIGMTGPSSNCVSGSQHVVGHYEDLSQLDGFAWSWGQSQCGVVEETDRLVGFCLLIKREVIDAIGLLDEQFGIGNFEDDDYCLRARAAGFRLVIARESFVHHFGGATFSSVAVDYAALMRANEARFREKWEVNEAVPALPTAKLDVEQEAPKLLVKVSPDGGLLLETHCRLSGCLIVRDNAATIRACLKSLRPWVDELVVVDTGSRDETPQIAAEIGARVYHFPWCDDFSAARNESIRHARGEWVFWMDSDDTIDEVNGRGLRSLVEAPNRDGVLGYVVQVHCPGAGPTGRPDVVAVDHVKLFRNQVDLRFEGRIHEQILPAIRRAGGNVEWTELFVVHSGYDHSPEGQVRKRERDLRLLALEFRERPNHPFTLFNLGMTHSDINQHTDALRYLEASLEHSNPGESHRRKAYALLAYSLAQIGRPGDALAACDRGLLEFEGDLELQFRRATLLHGTGRFPEAIDAYRQILSGEKRRYFTSVDRGLGGYKAHQNLAAVYADAGDWTSEEIEWRAVVADVPDYCLGWRGLGDCLLRQQKIAEAETLAKNLKSQASLSCEGHILAGRIAIVHGKKDRAQQEWEAAAAADSNDPEPLRWLARVYFETRTDREAERVLRDLILRDPDDPAAHHNLGSVLLRQGLPSQAIPFFQRSIALRPGSIDTHMSIGYAFRECGETRLAADTWKAVLELDPTNRDAVVALESVR